MEGSKILSTKKINNLNIEFYLNKSGVIETTLLVYNANPKKEFKS